MMYKHYLSKLRAIAYDNLNVPQIMEFFFDRLENIKKKKGVNAVGSIFSFFNNNFKRHCHLGRLTLSQTTNFRLFQTESLQTTVLNLMKMADSSPEG